MGLFKPLELLKVFPLYFQLYSKGFPSHSVFKPMADAQRSLSSSNCNDHIGDALHMTEDKGTRTGTSYSGREQPTRKPLFWVSVT